METIISFGYWIRRQRKALDLTQQALADRVGCSLAAIKKIERDERKPSRILRSSSSYTVYTIELTARVIVRQMSLADRPFARSFTQYVAK